MVATVMQRYRNSYPRVMISCEESNSTVLLEKVIERRVDAALVRLPLPVRRPGRRASGRGGHARGAAGRTIASPGDGASISPILRTTRSSSSLGRSDRICIDSMIGACRRAGFTPSIGMSSPQISSTVNLVAAGLRRHADSRFHTADPCRRRVLSRTARQAAAHEHCAGPSAKGAVASGAESRQGHSSGQHANAGGPPSGRRARGSRRAAVTAPTLCIVCPSGRTRAPGAADGSIRFTGIEPCGTRNREAIGKRSRCGVSKVGFLFKTGNALR